MHDLRVVSLFDGISCGRVALERAGIGVSDYIAYEIEANAIKISKQNWEDIQHNGDVLTADYKEYEGFDLLIGGSPCTNFSLAGNKKGAVTSDNLNITTYEQYMELKKKGTEFSGQSYLFWEYIRALKEIKPKYFLLENVKMKKEWLDVITGALGVEPIRLNSNLFSAQNRDRYYWTNIPLNVECLVPDTSVIKDIIREEDNDKYHLSEQHKQGFLRSYDWRGQTLQEKSKPLLASYYKKPPHCPYIECAVSESGYRMFSPVECERLQTLPDNYTEGFSNTARYKCIGNAWTVNVIAYLFSGLNTSEE